MHLHFQLLHNLHQLRVGLLQPSHLRVCAQRKPLAVLVAGQRHDLFPNFLEVYAGRRLHADLGKRGHAHEKLLQASNRISCAHADVYVHRHFFVEQVIRDLVHAVFLEQLGFLTGNVQHVLVGFVKLLQQHQLAQHGGNKSLAERLEQVFGQHRGRRLQHGHGPSRLAGAVGHLNAGRAKVTGQLVKVGVVAVFLGVGAGGDVRPAVLDHVFLRVVHEHHAPWHVAHQSRQVHVLATFGKIALVQHKLDVIKPAVFDFVDLVLKAAHQLRHRGRNRLVRLDHGHAHHVRALAVEHGRL